MTMPEKTNGIVLKYIRYGESSAVCKIFTRSFGLKSFMLKGAIKKKSGKQSVLQPFTPVEVTFRMKESNQLQYLHGIARSLSIKSIPFDIRKSTICIFLDEVLYNTLSEDYVNEDLFDFVERFIQLLDLSEKPENYHLFFLVRLTRFYGFPPQTKEDGDYFNLAEGGFINHLSGVAALDKKESLALRQLINTNADQLEDVRMSVETRQALLRGMMEYFKLHLGNWKPVRSLEVFDTVFH